MSNHRIVFILGPSGVGKTTFGEFLSSVRGFLHIEIDIFNKNGIDLNDLREEWDRFLNYYDVIPLKNKLILMINNTGKHDCIVTFPSTLILSPNHIQIAKKHAIEVRYLYGSTVFCSSRFFRREIKMARGLDANHWVLHNSNLHYTIGKVSFKPYRIEIEKERLGQLDWETVFQRIF